MADRPWPEYGKGGKPITQNRLAEMLSKFTTKAGIPVRSKDIRVGDKVRRGYSREKLENSFSRYLGDQSATPLQPKETAAYSDFQSATPNPDVALRNGPKPAENLGCSGVALQNPPSGEKNKNDDDGDLEEREAIQAIDVLLEIPEFLRRT